MVLVNGLTIDDINAALIALQRGQGEVVGGVKNTTVQNISISNSGGSGGPDFTPQINALQKTAADLTERVETLEDKQTETEQTVDEIITRLNNAGIQRVIWQESNRTLYFYMSDRQLFVEIPAETVTLTLGNDNVLHFTMGEGENAFPQTIDLALPFIRTSEKGVAGGVATLDNNGRVPYSQLPESAMEYKGKWDASTNTPHLADGTGTNGDFYVCSAPGTVTFGTGNTITFVVNDRVIYDGTDDMWEKLPAGAVSSVNGQTGDVTLDANDIDYSSTKTVKQAIDDIQPVQADWEQSDSSAPDYIKNKIPIWIASGSASDNMTPVDSVTSGEMRPVTSNAVAQEGYLTSADITNQVTVDNMQSVSSNAVANRINSLVENYYTLVSATAINTSTYANMSFISGRKLSDYDFIDFYVGIYDSGVYYPRGFIRIPSLLFKPFNDKLIFRVDIPLVGSNNENVSFRYSSDTSVDVRAFNTSTTFYAKILGEKIT